MQTCIFTSLLAGSASAHKAVQSFEKLRVIQTGFFKYYGWHILKAIIIQGFILISVERSHLKMVLIKNICDIFGGIDV
jgi:hypothetical protein